MLHTEQILHHLASSNGCSFVPDLQSKQEFAECVSEIGVCCLSVLCACACMCSAHARVHRCMHADATPTQTHARARTHTQALVFFYGRGCIKHQCRPTAWATMDVLAKGVQASVPRVYSGSDAASEASFLSNDNKVGRSKRAAYRARATAHSSVAPHRVTRRRGRARRPRT